MTTGELRKLCEKAIDRKHLTTQEVYEVAGVALAALEALGDRDLAGCCAEWGADLEYDPDEEDTCPTS